MLRRGLTLMAALGLFGAKAPGAQADLCFRYGSGGGTLVAKGAQLPDPNKCRTLSFFEEGGAAGAGTGSICRAANGGTVIFHYSYHGCLAPSYFETGTCRLDTTRGLPAEGTCRLTFIVNDTPNDSVDSTPVLTSCNRPVPSAFPGVCRSTARVQRPSRGGVVD